MLIKLLFVDEVQLFKNHRIKILIIDLFTDNPKAENNEGKKTTDHREQLHKGKLMYIFLYLYTIKIVLKHSIEVVFIL
jgi:hypothetical protein